MSARTGPEAAFQQQVLDLAGIYGWRCAHFRPAQTAKGWRTAVAGDGAGFPDLVLVRGPELIFAELKANKGRLSAAQEQWIADLQQVAETAIYCASSRTTADGERHVWGRAVEVYLWRPSDFDDVNARLARGRQPARRAAA